MKTALTAYTTAESITATDEHRCTQMYMVKETRTRGIYCFDAVVFVRGWAFFTYLSIQLIISATVVRTDSRAE